MNKKIWRELINKFSIETIEQHLIYTYLTSKKLTYHKSSILNPLLIDIEINSKLSLLIDKLQITNIKILENYLELLIPGKDRKLNGAFFTPNYIIDFILYEVQPQLTDKCLDPSCGSGAFLIGLAEYYKNHFNQSLKETIQKNIFGSDILDYNIKRAKWLLSIYALEHGEILEEADFNLHHQDSLRSDWTEQFDVVVGNPPYVKYQDLSDENRQFLLKEWKTIQNGTFNLYFAFFELGYQLLKPNGKLGYITPNNYFTSLAGKNLRAFFTQNKCVYRIVDFSHKRVFDAQTYTALTFINKKENPAITYDRIKQNQSPDIFLLNANGSPNFWKNLNIKKWRLLKTKEQKNIKIIETIGTPLKQLFDMCVGIATLKDEVFFVDTQNVDGKYILKSNEQGTFKIETEVTKPVYKISNFKNQTDIKHNTRRIIFPYQIQNGIAQAIPEKTFKQKFPQCYQYLSSEKEKLAKRDKGKVKYNPFYVWGRTQGLAKKGKKILNPTFSQYPRFLLVEEEDAFFTNGYGIYFKDEDSRPNLFSQQINPISSVENRDVVQKILNSIVMHYYVTKTSVSIAGGYPCYQKNFIEKFTIPDLNQQEIEWIRRAEQEEVNQFLIEKYDLKIQMPNLV